MSVIRSVFSSTQLPSSWKYPPGITFSSDPSGSRSVDELLFSSVDFLKPLSIIAFSVPILYPLATLKQQHTYINFITTTIHYYKKKHSRPGVLQPTKIKSESPERESNPHTRFGRPVCCLCITRANNNGHDRTRTCV